MAEVQESNGGSKGYGKRPLWQWILLYVIVGGVIYFAVYYFFFRNNTSLYGNSSNQSQTQSQTSTKKDTSPDVNNSAVTTKTDSALGKYLADPSGKALYTNSGDGRGTSGCTASCLTAWPAYIDMGSTENLPTDVTVVKRTDNGEMQFAYKGMPLYYFASDANGRVTGNGVGNFSIVQP